MAVNVTNTLPFSVLVELSRASFNPPTHPHFTSISRLKTGLLELQVVPFNLPTHPPSSRTSTMEAWFDAFVSKFKQKGDATSPVEYVATHLLPPDVVPVSQDVKRDDVRAVGTYAGPRFEIPGGDIQKVNVFSDVSQHRHAAATFASLAQKKAGFNVTASDIEAAFQKYIDDFAQIHWNLLRAQKHTVHHDEQNHAKFLTDLVEIVSDELEALKAGKDTITTIVDSIKSLANRIALSSNSVETQTLYDSSAIANEGEDVVFSIFFTTLEMRHHLSFKSEVLSTSAATYSILMALNSAIVVQHADIYNQLAKSSAEDFVNEHTFPEPMEVRKKSSP